MKTTSVIATTALTLLVILSLFIWSLGSGPVLAANSAPMGCKQWEIKLVPAKAGKVEAGWEPISGILYGEGGEMGVLLRRCAG